MSADARRPTPYRLAAGHDIPALAQAYRVNGRVRIHNLLADPHHLKGHLASAENWRQALNAGEKVFELDRATRAALSVEKAAALDAAVYGGAEHGFQFRYETIRVPDDDAARIAIDDPLAEFARWMSGGEMREFLRAVVDQPLIDFVDAQATCFTAGDFLTGHDDLVAGKHRHAAYVFGLTPIWRLEWGGLLIFQDIGGEGDCFHGLVPGFNCLDLFSVPQLHSVSLISAAATQPRLSVTGWLRSVD